MITLAGSVITLAGSVIIQAERVIILGDHLAKLDRQDDHICRLCGHLTCWRDHTNEGHPWRSNGGGGALRLLKQVD